MGRKRAQDLTGAARAGIREASVRSVASREVNASVMTSANTAAPSQNCCKYPAGAVKATAWAPLSLARR